MNQIDMNSNGQEFIDWKNQELYSNEGSDEYYTDEGDKCPKCGGNMLVSYVSSTPDGVKTWTCKNCGLTESE